MKYVAPTYEKSVVETEDVLTVSGVKIEENGKITFEASKLFG